MSTLSAVTVCAAMGFASGAGYNAYIFVKHLQQRSRHKDKVRVRENDNLNIAESGSAIDAKVIELLRRETISETNGATLRLPNIFAKSIWLERNVTFAGFQGVISEGGFCAARVKLSVACALLGALLGVMVSGAFAVVLGIVGCFLGATAPKRALKHRVDWRTSEMERHLPEMLDVVAIGMRSGLSFDRSLQIYSARFNTILASEFALAEKKWVSGLQRRDESLRELAESYNSIIFMRVVETIVRSIRFGTSMVESLEAAAREARVTYRSNKQEQVAKAPVKMMVPTGTLILPAMLIMVLGPVLLEMIGGGF
ncbi:type II secretion system F family protein [Adlercreutzia sp. ZJ154]|uniref:type II secretion system F family protein n=1 Tax=Adlercreutzia sp. ZJ154 TaxID=2709790 RepID=UPI0013EBFC54|nr:type II secretion system F family protein [Adlercreutzia sp. ZJ154]